MRKILLLLPCLTIALSAAAQTDGNAPQKRFWVSIDGGYSYRVAKAAEGDMKHVVTNMRGGYSLGADVHYEFWRHQGLGARFSHHNYSHNVAGLSSEVNNWYIAPSYRYRTLLPNGKGARPCED